MKAGILMLIQKAERHDLQEILGLQYLAYQSEAKLLNNPHIPPLKQTLEEVEKEYLDGLFLKAVDTDNRISGSVRAYSKEGTLFIGKLIVRPDLQGQGIGTQLLHAMEAACPHNRYELFTSSKSVRNIKLYERLGYKIFNEKPVSEDLKFIYLEKILSS